MHQYQRELAHSLLKDRGLSRALFAHPHTITWLSGFAPPIQLGPHLFAGGPPLIWYESGHFSLFIVDAYKDSTLDIDLEPDCSVVSHPGYTFEEPLAGFDKLARSLADTVGHAGLAPGKIAIEARAVPTSISTQLSQILGDKHTLTPIDGLLEAPRMVKRGEELIKLRENFALADVGQAAARREVQIGKREIDIWNAAQGAIQRSAGGRVPLGNDCIVSSRQNNFTGWPLDHEIRAGDSIIVDLGTRLGGYWSDGCGTYYPQEPTQEQKRIHKTAAAALELALSLVRPGVRVRDIDHKVRHLISASGYPDYPHHTGHGVGVSSHEAPRIVPYSEEVLQEGMVIMLEPGIYLPGEFAVRLEDALLVTGDGAEVLTLHDKSPP